MSDSTETDLLNIFRDEVSAYLETLNTLLLRSETATAVDSGTANPEDLREMNRVAHSMKGASRAVGLKVIETIAHYMEEVFDSALNQQLELVPEVCDLLYDGLDLIQHVVDGEDPNEEALALVLAGLEQVVVKGPDAAEILSPVRQLDDIDAEVVDVMREIGEYKVPPAAGKDTGTAMQRPSEESIRVPVGKLDRLMAEVSELLVARMQAEERMRQVQSLRRLHNKWRREWQGIRAAYIRLARRLEDRDAGGSGDTAIIFDFLENNQRYLAAANHNLTQLVQALGQDNLRLTTLSDQFQDDVGGMRMLAFETLLGGFQRIVRDIARDTGKEVYLDIEGRW
jgi:two-component system chemotaxis sensor kinase CheA